MKWRSILLGVLIAFLTVISSAPLFTIFASDYVTPSDPSLTVSDWEGSYWHAVIVAGFWSSALSAIWLWAAHYGRGLDTKRFLWTLLAILSVFGGTIILWLFTPGLREGASIPLAIVGLFAGLGYWLASLLMTPSHYIHTPWLLHRFIRKVL
jgi:hypothetical protein